MAQQGERAAVLVAVPNLLVPPLADVLSAIRESHRLRQDYHSAEKRLTLQIKGIQRRVHQANCAKAKAAFAAGKLPTCLKTCSDDIYASLPLAATHLDGMRAKLEMLRGAKATPQESGRARRVGPEVDMERLAKQLPVYPWVESVKGFGALGLAQVIAECGDLSTYVGPAKVWTRMGLGLYRREDGAWERQQKAAGQNGVLAQYNPRRRSLLYCIGESLIKSDGPYRAIYDARKVQEQAKPACGKFKCKGERCTDGHIHNRAKRYMEKQLLKDLWQEWRRAKHSESTVRRLPIAAPAEVCA